jgi:hypothetical protein
MRCVCVCFVWVGVRVCVWVCVWVRVCLGDGDERGMLQAWCLPVTCALAAAQAPLGVVCNGAWCAVLCCAVLCCAVPRSAAGIQAVPRNRHRHQGARVALEVHRPRCEWAGGWVRGCMLLLAPPQHTAACEQGLLSPTPPCACLRPAEGVQDVGGARRVRQEQAVHEGPLPGVLQVLRAARAAPQEQGGGAPAVSGSHQQGGGRHTGTRRRRRRHSGSVGSSSQPPAIGGSGQQQVHQQQARRHRAAGWRGRRQGSGACDDGAANARQVQGLHAELHVAGQAVCAHLCALLLLLCSLAAVAHRARGHVCACSARAPHARGRPPQGTPRCVPPPRPPPPTPPPHPPPRAPRAGAP